MHGQIVGQPLASRPRMSARATDADERRKRTRATMASTSAARTALVVTVPKSNAASPDSSFAASSVASFNKRSSISARDGAARRGHLRQ